MAVVIYVVFVVFYVSFNTLNVRLSYNDLMLFLGGEKHEWQL